MRADGQQPEQSPSHFLWTSVKYESKYVMSQKVVRSPKANSPYESRAETEAAVERIHERFKDIRAAIAKEKAQKTSAAADSHPSRVRVRWSVRLFNSRLEPSPRRVIRLMQHARSSVHPSTQ